MPRRRFPKSASPRPSLHRQGYNFVSSLATAAVKPCMWCKRSLRGGEQCYKHQFYGIESWRCVQMTPTLNCNQRCLFCWRSMEHELEAEAELSPEEIVSAVPRLQRRGLSGDKPFVSKERWETATSAPNQFAISLSGEPTLYPKLPELINLLSKNGSSVFVVSNGTNPEMIQKIFPTQLYLSLDAVDVEGYAALCRPMGEPFEMWERVLTSLSLLRKKEEEGVKTAVRITLVRGFNDSEPEKFGEVIREAAPMFVEVKGYMYLGYSRMRLTENSVPEMDEIRLFSNAVAKAADYQILDENTPSRVVCLVRKT